METIISANNISKIYKGVVQFTALHPVSLSIKRKSINLIMGKSGSGKSTFLNILGGMDDPTKGEVFFKGKSYYKLNEFNQSKIRGNNFGYIFQAFNLIYELSVENNIKLPLIINRKVLDQKYFSGIIESLDLKNKLKLFPSQLSGGEQQRVAIARAMINKPEIIFADEPTGNLDEESGRNVVNCLEFLNKNFDVTLIIVTHDKELINKYDNLYIIKDGVIYKTD